jgi:hypothetical protein
MKNTALTVAGIIFSVVAALHFLRFYKAWVIVIGNNTIPLDWSIYGGAITVILAVWMFIAARK